jgi:antitoxin CptB
MTETPSFDQRMARAKFRAWHRGTREADYMIGGFYDRYHAAWGEDELAWFEALLDADDVDVMAWALGSQQPPEDIAGDLLTAMQRLDYVDIPR